MIKARQRFQCALGVTLATVVAGCGALDVESGPDGSHSAEEADRNIESIEQELVTENGLTAVNGLMSSNGLITTNGLATLNGLSLTNGLKAVNGLNLINGLATRQGLTTVNGLSVNCYGKSDSACTDPDGLLSKTTGMMKDAGGVTTAQYLIRCALRPDQFIRIRAYTGAFVTMSGEVGMAPEWATSSCTTDCEEKVSSCLLAFINQNGVHRRINMTAGWTGNPLGTSHAGYPVLESSFFGNLFRTPVKAYVVSGYDHAQSVANVENGVEVPTGLDLRSCYAGGTSSKNISTFLTRLPYCSATHIGSSVPAANGWSALRSDPTKYNKCSFAATDAAEGGVPSRSTALACSGPGTSTQSWRFPVSTWRAANPWIDYCPNDPYKAQQGLCGCGAADPVDVTGYIDAQGYTCSGWVGYDCSQAAEAFGYTPEQEASILSNCGSSCRACSTGVARCVTANENSTASLSCSGGQVIKSISFASYGLPTGTCPPAQGICHAASSESTVKALCLNKQSCSVGATNAQFGDPCTGVVKKLAITYTCG